jgi:hypothetical protein
LPVDVVCHRRRIAQNVVVPVSQDAVAEGSESARAFGVVVLLCGVLASVQLDDDSRLRAGEIGDVAGDGDLPAEAEAIELALAQVLPERARRRWRGCAAGGRGVSGPSWLRAPCRVPLRW